MGEEGGISEGLSWGDVERVSWRLREISLACGSGEGGSEGVRASDYVSWFIEFDVTLALTGECLCSAQQQPDRKTVVGLRRNRESLRLPEACGRSLF
jgi:hypothetical protein